MCLIREEEEEEMLENPFWFIHGQTTVTVAVHGVSKLVHLLTLSLYCEKLKATFLVSSIFQILR